MTTARFADYIRQDMRTYRVALPFCFTPYPVVGMPAPVLRRYVEGKDPVTGKSLMEEVIDSLTEAPAGGEERRAAKETLLPRFLRPDTEDHLRGLFLKNGWTDGLPIVLPTRERVAAMLEGTSHSPDEAVGAMSISESEAPKTYTVEKVAVNAVMAGAAPEHLPAILALASTGHPAFPSSTTSFATMVVVNGPVRNELKMNAGVGAMSPLNYANAVLGRAWTLMTINFGNTRVGETFLGSQGNNLNYNNMCFAENEERSPWEPFHVQKGFRSDENVVSVFRGWSVLNSMGCINQRPAQEETVILMKAFSGLRSAATLILDPLVARNLRDMQGFKTKGSLCRWLSENVLVPARQYWAADLIYAFMLPLAEQGIEPYASWARLADDALLGPFNDPERINVVVAGGETNAFWKTTDFDYVLSASVDKWR
jgi:hypothetical protein